MKPAVPDPYQYGWRYVRVVAPDGKETFDEVPLTLEDVLFPEEEDFIVHTQGYVRDVLYLGGVFEAQLADDATAAVIADCRVDWNLPGVRPLGPDVAVFSGVKRHIDWSTFNVAAEGAKPRLVVEVTSPETRQNDLGRKKGFYHQAKVPQYVIVDAAVRGGKRRLELMGYRYERRGYRRIAPDEKGRIYLDAVGLWLGVTRDRRGGYDRLACYDPETGQELGDYAAVMEAISEAKAEARAAKQQARLETQARAEAEARANEAEARIRELEADLKRSRGRKA